MRLVAAATLFGGGMCLILVAVFWKSIPMIHAMQAKAGQDPTFPRLTSFVRTHNRRLLLIGTLLLIAGVVILANIGPREANGLALVAISGS